MEPIVEVVIFDVKKKLRDEWAEAMRQWIEYLKGEPSFVSYKYLRSSENPRIHIQILEFTNKKDAQAILEKYRDRIGVEKFDAFFGLLNKKPHIEYYDKMEFD